MTRACVSPPARVLRWSHAWSASRRSSTAASTPGSPQVAYDRSNSSQSTSRGRTTPSARVKSTVCNTARITSLAWNASHRKGASW